MSKVSLPLLIETTFHSRSDADTGVFMPPTSEGIMKFCRDVSFTHNVYHGPSGCTLSVPPESTDQMTWGQAVPPGLKQEMHDVMSRLLGDEAKDLSFDSYKLCLYLSPMILCEPLHD